MALFRRRYRHYHHHTHHSDRVRSLVYRQKNMDVICLDKPMPQRLARGYQRLFSHPQPLVMALPTFFGNHFRAATMAHCITFNLALD